MGIFYKNNGAITVFLSLILVPMLILAGIAVDAIRIYGAKAIASDSAELAMNTALASYDQILKDVYGLLSISADENELSNNLIKYFENTINSMGLELNEDDSYTKTIIEDIKNLINSPEKLEFNNLIDMETVNFTASGVDGTQLYYPETVKRQVVEYMKYRAAISIGGNFYDKLNIFKEIPKQQEVIETKVDYENALSDIHTACKEAYAAIMSYGKLKNELGNYTIDNFYMDVKKGTGAYFGAEDVNKLLITVYANDAFAEKPSQIRIDTSELSYHDIRSYLNSQIIQDIINSVGKSEERRTADEIIKYYFILNENIANIVKAKRYFSAVADKFYEYRDDLIREFNIEENRARKEAEKNNQIYIPRENTALIIAEREYNELMHKLSFQMPGINACYDDLENRKDNIGNLAEKETEKLNLDLHAKYLLVKEMKNQAGIASERLDILLNEVIPDIEVKNKELESKINSLSEGDVKNSLKLQYTETAKFLDKDEIKKLTDIMKNNAVYNEKLMQNLDSTKYFEKLIVAEKINISVNNLSKSISFHSTNYSSAIAEAGNMFSNLFYAPDAGNLKGVSSKGFNDKPFFLYLDKMFGSSIDDSNADIYKKEAKAKKKNLLDVVNTTISSYENEIENESVSNEVPVEGEIYEDLATTLINVSLNETGGNVDKLLSSDNMEANKKITKAQTDTMKSSIGVIEGLKSFAGDFSEGVRDNILITEYMTEMFSCRTTNIDNTIEKTLSGIELSKENNYLFGSETEYLLWGQKDENTRKNSLYTASSIFGLRFVLNTIYAYTDAEIKSFTLAVAIALAGFTGFGVPIVQNILLLALAMGESALDVSKLLDGQDVVIYKTYTSWVLKPSGITKDAVSYTLKSVTEEALDNLSDQIINLAESKTDEKVYRLEKAFDEYSENLADDLAVSVSNLILTPIQTELMMWIETDNLANTNSLNDFIDNMYTDLREEILKEPESFAKGIKLIVVDLFVEKKLKQLKAEINNALVSFNNNIDALKGKIEGCIKNSVADLTSEAKTIIFDNGYEKLKNDAKESFQNLSGDIKQNANKVIDDFVNKITVGDSASSDFSNYKTGITTNLTVSYKEYIKIFLFAGMLAGKDDVYISRMCDLIKLNFVCASNAPMPDFMLKDSYTMIKIDAQASVRTTFMRHKIFANPWDENKCYIYYSTIYGY